MDAIAEYLGTELDYNNPQRKTGLRIGKRRFGTAKLENIINSLADTETFPGDASRALATLLAGSTEADLIQNRVLRNEYVETPKYTKRKAARRKGNKSSNSTLFSTPKATSTPQRGKGIAWIDLY